MHTQCAPLPPSLHSPPVAKRANSTRASGFLGTRTLCGEFSARRDACGVAASPRFQTAPAPAVKRSANPFSFRVCTHRQLVLCRRIVTCMNTHDYPLAHDQAAEPFSSTARTHAALPLGIPAYRYRNVDRCKGPRQSNCHSASPRALRRVDYCTVSSLVANG